MTERPHDAPAAAVPRAWVRFSEALASVICERVARGETLAELCRDPQMPSRASVKQWRKVHAGFGRRYGAALIAGRHLPRGEKRRVWHPAVAALICERVASGMSLGQACDLPGLPCQVTVYSWVKTKPEFAQAYAQARMIQAHVRFDQVWEMAQAATTATVSLAKLRIDAARWQAARMAPKRYGVRAQGAEDETDGDDEVEVQTVRVMKFAAQPGEPAWEDVSWPLRRPGPPVRLAGGP